MKLHYEWGIRQLRKHGEELCGDAISVSRESGSVALALSDGLGSGVKANILATLTTQIAMRMLQEDLAIEEVVKTLTETLPVCAVRKLAYSTFAIAQFSWDGTARIVEFDSPRAILLHDRRRAPVEFRDQEVEGRTIEEADVRLTNGDWVIFVSDGVLNAGIGGAYPLGWGWEKVASFAEERARQDYTADQFAERIADAVSELYIGQPGDDVSVVVIKVRLERSAMILTGPPADRSKEAEIVRRIVECAGKRAVCGGTTAKIVSKHAGRPLEVDLSTGTEQVPPIARMDGFDLVSEGILTLTRVRQLLSAGFDAEAVKFRNDGAADLIRLLLEVDQVHFIVGTAVNPAHQNPGLPQEIGLRLTVVREIADELKQRGKAVDIETV